MEDPIFLLMNDFLLSSVLPGIITEDLFTTTVQGWMSTFHLSPLSKCSSFSEYGMGETFKEDNDYCEELYKERNTDKCVEEYRKTNGGL